MARRSVRTIRKAAPQHFYAVAQSFADRPKVFAGGLWTARQIDDKRAATDAGREP